MTASGYSVDDILEEIRRKKEREPLPAEKEPAAQRGADFFEMREKKAVQPEVKAEVKAEAPTYTKKYNDEPITTRTIQVDDTLSQYFGPTEWKNGKRPRDQKNQISSKVGVTPAHETKRDEEASGFVPKDMSRHFAETNVRGFEKISVDTPEPKVKDETGVIGGFAAKKNAENAPEPAAKPQQSFAEVLKEETRQSAEPERKVKKDLTASTNHDLYKEFTEKRRDKVEEFMKMVAEPTNQEISLPSVAEEPPVVNKFSETTNREIAQAIIGDMHEKPDNFDDDDDKDYESPSQTEAVRSLLSTQKTSIAIRLVIVGILFLLSMIFCLSPLLKLELPELIAFSKDSSVFPIINLVLVLMGALTCHTAVGGGLLSLIKFRSGNDTFVACSVLGSAVLGTYFAAMPSAMAADGANLFFPITLLTLFFNTFGKLLSASRVKKNFEALNKEGEKSALLTVHNKELAMELTGQKDETPRFCAGAKADFFTDFLELSFRGDATESVARTVAPIVLICSLIVAGVAFLLTGKISDVVTGFSAVLCIAAPFSATLAGALPVARSCGALNKEGSMLAGGNVAETFAETDSVLLDVEQLFPEGSITLHGIKTFAQGRIDDAIIDAASVICSTRSTIGSIFMNVVQGDRRLLRPVDTVIYEDGMGLSAWVNSKRVLFGNRELMINHGVDIPSHDYEEKYVGQGKDILYLSNSGQLTAMFIISYRADKEVYRALGVMAERGVRLVINCTDPNITVSKLCDLFAYPEGQMKLLSSKYQQKCAELTEKREKAPAAAVFDGSLSSLSDLINCCGIIRQSSFASALLEMIGIVIGFIIVTLFLFTGNISSLHMYLILAYQAFWLLAVTGMISLRKKI